MTSRDRVIAALRHQETDRPPYCILVTGETVEQIQAHYGVDDVEAWLDNDIKQLRMPWWKWKPLAPDWGQPGIPTSPALCIGTGDYTDLEDNIKAMRDQSNKYFLVTIYGSHIEKAQNARGFENQMADMGMHYSFAKKLCQTIIEKNLVMLENFLSIAEIDGVLLGSDWGSQRGLLMAPDMWDDLIRPGEQAEYDLVHSYGKDVWVHSCGDIQQVLGRLVDMGLDALNPVQPECMDLASVKADYGEKLTFWGGLSTQQTLPFGTPEEVKAESRRVIDIMAPGGGYVFSPAQAIQGDVPPENIEALLDVARNG